MDEKYLVVVGRTKVGSCGSSNGVMMMVFLAFLGVGDLFST